MYYAELKNGIVQRVIVADQGFINSGVVGDPATWVETTDNNPTGIGYTYDTTLGFIPPKPYDSWILDEQKKEWTPPVPMPALSENEGCVWKEDEQVWEKKLVIIEPK